MVNIREINYSNYGKCIELSNGLVDVCVTVDIGPRIIRYGFTGCKNMMHEDTERSGHKSGSAFDSYYGDGAKWYSYGGHRLWTSPESLPRTYYPDNAAVMYEICGNSVKLFCDEQIRNNIQMTTTLTLSENSSELLVEHEIKNTGAFDAVFAAWALSVMAGGGMCAVANTKRDTGLLSNRAVALWPYAKMNDERVYWGEDFITLRQQRGCGSAFKFGTTNENGYALYFNHNCMFVKKYTHEYGANYPDGGMSFESYTNDDFIEVETLSPLSAVSPGKSICHAERWQLFGNIEMPDADDEKTLNELVNKYVM